MTDIEQYDYHLPPELIAQFPLTNRSDSRLLVVNRAEGSIEHAHVRDIVQWLRPEDCLVLNNTRVIPARLHGYRESTGGRWSGLFVRAESPPKDAEESGFHWLVMSKTRGKLLPGEAIVLRDRDGREAGRLRMLALSSDGMWVARPEPPQDHVALLERVGHVPLPPYIRSGRMTDADRERYQTVFAREAGAIAAPTAGLHFSETLLTEIRQHGCATVECTLHVGVGTFKPIAVSQLAEHQMHSEWGCVAAEAVATIVAHRKQHGRSIAIGTTVVRLLESASANGALEPWVGSTDLFIRPPYQFRSVDALLTNFHLPKSTLLVLVRTFGGEALIKQAYEAAIAERYRFYSYGDAMLIV